MTPPPEAGPGDALRRVLALTRARLRLRDTLAGLSLWLGATLGSGLVLIGLAAALGPRPQWRPLAGAWCIAVVSGLLFVLSQRRRDRFSDERVARFLGQRVPDLRSDLLSAVELGLRPGPHADGDRLIAELCQRTAAAAATLPPQQLFDLATGWRSFGLLAAVLAVGLCGAIFAPSLYGQGLQNLLQVPPELTQVSSEPLVGDLRLLLTPPRYTGLPQRTIPGASGEVLALPGTTVRVEARALGPVARAQLVVQTGDGETTRPVQLVALKGEGEHPYPLLATGFLVKRPGQYYFVVERDRHDRVRESDGHRIDLEQDHPPRVDLFVPSEDLEITGNRRVELAYSAEDDYGLGEIDLVFKVGDQPERRKRLRSLPPPPAPGAKVPQPVRTAAAKIEWDLAELDLKPGSRVSYHLEARDLDDVNGPNAGVSRTYTLRISSPREKHDARIARQEALLEQALALLADRIELSASKGDRDKAPPGTEPAADPVERTLDIHRRTEGFLLLVGRLQEELSRLPAAEATGVPKDLRPVLAEIGKRLGKLSQDEEALLGDLRARRPAPGDGKRARPQRSRELAALNDRHVAELERDSILLDDLLGRQKLEDLLAISDEIGAARDRLKQLMAAYKKTRSAELREEIEREVRGIERRLQELAERAQRLQGEVPDEFLNSEAMGQNNLQSRLDHLRDLLEKGEVDKAMAELDRLSQGLDNLAKGMENDLRGYRRERYTAEDKALSEIEDRLADLSHDEEMLRHDTEELRSEASQRARQLLRDRSEQLSRRLQEQVSRLRKQIADVDAGPLGPWGTDEMDKARKRVDDVGRMLEQGDLEEARAMAQEAEGSISRLIDEMRGEEQAARFGQRAQLARSRQRLEGARPMARDLADQIARALPRGDELLSPERQRFAGELRARQESVRRRGEQLGRDAARKAKEIKDAALLERMNQELGEGLRKAGGHMAQAEGELKKLAPRSAESEEGQAVEQLQALRKQVQQARRPRDDGQGARLDREPVKIPDADEYRAPREFRQDILEAAKRDAPGEFKDQVKRYYEELIK